MLKSMLAAVLVGIAMPVAAQTFVDAGRDGLLEMQEQPPADDSIAGRADVEAVLIIQRLRSPDAEREATIDGDLPARVWAHNALGPDYSPERHPAAFALFDAVRADMTKVVDDVKAKGAQRKRPHQRDPRVKPSLSVEGHGSNAWPSGRTAATRVWATVLSDLFPARGDVLATAARRSAELRLIGGVHYPTDLIAGERLADQFLVKLRANRLYRERLAAAQAAAR